MALRSLISKIYIQIVRSHDSTRSKIWHIIYYSTFLGGDFRARAPLFLWGGIGAKEVCFCIICNPDTVIPHLDKCKCPPIKKLSQAWLPKPSELSSLCSINPYLTLPINISSQLYYYYSILIFLKMTRCFV